jgi:DNA-binding transcriptional LysR family regulator
MKALDDRRGVALFDRGVRTLSLTDGGTHYLEHVNDLFAKLESVTDPLGPMASRGR